MFVCWSLLYCAILFSWTDSRLSCRMWFRMSDWTIAIYSAFWTCSAVVCLQHCLVITCLVPRETAAVSVQRYNHAPVDGVIQNHIRRMQVSLAVACLETSSQLDCQPWGTADPENLCRENSYQRFFLWSSLGLIIVMLSLLASAGFSMI